MIKDLSQNDIVPLDEKWKIFKEQMPNDDGFIIFQMLYSAKRKRKKKRKLKLI